MLMTTLRSPPGLWGLDEHISVHLPDIPLPEAETYGLTTEGRTVKNKGGIIAPLKEIWFPKDMIVIHCKGHQPTNTPEAQGNHRADQAAQ